MVDVVDTAFHGSSFPSSYTGPGTLIANPRFAPDARHLALSWTGSGNAVSIPLGVEPLRIRIINQTDVIVWEWVRGMVSTHTLKAVAAGTLTDDTTSAILVAGDTNNGNLTVTLSAALSASAKALTAVIDY